MSMLPRLLDPAKGTTSPRSPNTIVILQRKSHKNPVPLPRDHHFTPSLLSSFSAPPWPQSHQRLLASSSFFLNSLNSSLLSLNSSTTSGSCVFASLLSLSSSSAPAIQIGLSDLERRLILLRKSWKSCSRRSRSARSRAWSSGEARCWRGSIHASELEGGGWLGFTLKSSSEEGVTHMTRAGPPMQRIAELEGGEGD